MEDIQYLTPSNLNLLGIRDLRSLAFAVGVYGYTLYNKQDLIMHIVDVVFGREAPKMETSKGRPSSITKNRALIYRQILEKIKSFENAEIQTYAPPMVASSKFIYNTSTETELNVVGYAEKFENNFYVRSNSSFAWTTPCFIPNELAQEHNIRTGDKINGVASLDETGNYFLTTFENPIEKRHKLFDLLQISKPTQQLMLKSSVFQDINIYAPIAKGSRTSISGTSKVLSSWKHELIQSTGSNNIIIIGSYIAPEELAELNEKYENVFAASFGEDETVQQRTVALGFERAKRLAEENKEAIIVLWSLSPILKCFDSNMALSTSNTNLRIDLSNFRHLCMSAHNTKEGNSITLLCFAENDNNVQSAINEQVSEIFTTKVVCTNSVDSLDFPLDKEKSFTTRSSEFQSKDLQKLATE